MVSRNPPPSAFRLSPPRPGPARKGAKRPMEMDGVADQYHGMFQGYPPPPPREASHWMGGPVVGDDDDDDDDDDDGITHCTQECMLYPFRGGRVSITACSRATPPRHPARPRTGWADPWWVMMMMMMMAGDHPMITMVKIAVSVIPPANLPLPPSS
jgi:hypothetical protein